MCTVPIVLVSKQSIMQWKDFSHNNAHHRDGEDQEGCHCKELVAGKGIHTEYGEHFGGFISTQNDT